MKIKLHGGPKDGTTEDFDNPQDFYPIAILPPLRVREWRKGDPVEQVRIFYLNYRLRRLLLRGIIVSKYFAEQPEDWYSYLAMRQAENAPEIKIWEEELQKIAEAMRALPEPLKADSNALS